MYCLVLVERFESLSLEPHYSKTVRGVDDERIYADDFTPGEPKVVCSTSTSPCTENGYRGRCNPPATNGYIRMRSGARPHLTNNSAINSSLNDPWNAKGIE